MGNTSARIPFSGNDTIMSIMETINYEGVEKDVYTVEAHGETKKVIVVKTMYIPEHSLAVVLLLVPKETPEEGRLTSEDAEYFDSLTVDLGVEARGMASSTKAFLKTCSTNNDWVTILAEELGAAPTGECVHGFPLWDFSEAWI